MTRHKTRELSKGFEAASALSSLQINTAGETQQLLTQPTRDRDGIALASKRASRRILPKSTLNKTQLGLPSRAEFAKAEAEYLASLSVKKKDKALITQKLFDDIWDVLHDRQHSKVRTPQFRFWVRKMFKLSAQAPPGDTGDTADLIPVVLHDGHPIAVQSQIYDIIGYCHQFCAHGGRDRTMAHVKTLYSWVPKELVAQYVKLCPTCKARYMPSASFVIRASGAPSPPLVPDAQPTPVMNVEYVSATRTLPLLPPPSAIIPCDSTWLAHLASEPGPFSGDSMLSDDFNVQLPPLLLPSTSRNPDDGITTRNPFNLPSLSEALSGSPSMGPCATPVQRVPFSVPGSLRTPQMNLRHLSLDHHYRMEIDPTLLNDAGRSHHAAVAALIDLPRKVLIPRNALVSMNPASSHFSHASSMFTDEEQHCTTKISSMRSTTSFATLGV